MGKGGGERGGCPEEAGVELRDTLVASSDFISI